MDFSAVWSNQYRTAFQACFQALTNKKWWIVKWWHQDLRCKRVLWLQIKKSYRKCQNVDNFDKKFHQFNKRKNAWLWTINKMNKISRLQFVRRWNAKVNNLRIDVFKKTRKRRKKWKISRNRQRRKIKSLQRARESKMSSRNKT